ncbi:YCF48-related protein [Hymenobacter cellulosivorans]|uniref:YCF48-related protein n=1 Tax=Hymenobacter cellulosivorans TaxID=2932249 RepID=A0ABY4F6K6_9BACT|nr:YCF48-related protein [Hymenobacter cellulosivorans]UOQ52168.1 YCF48-related protein [Hymenobacter cellulosivorans]
MKKLYALLFCLSLVARPVWAQWQAAYPLGIMATGVYFTSEQTGYVVGEQAGRAVIAKTTDSGVNWRKLASPAFGSSVRAVWFTAADTGYVLQEYNLLKTQDAGATWTNLGNLPTQAIAQGVQFTSARTGYVNCLNGAVYKTTNAGLSWQNTQVPAAGSNGSYGNNSRLTFPSAQVGYLIVGFELFKTSDAGASWQRLSGVSGGRYRAIMFRSVLEGYVNTDSGGTYATTDGGLTWTRLPGGWDTVDHLYFPTAQRGVLLSSYSTIRQTTDGGATTQAAYHSNYTFSWAGVHFPTARFGCAVGSDGAIVITRDGGSSWQMHNPSSTNLQPNYAMTFGRNGQGIIGGEAAGLWRTADYGQSWVVDEQTLPSYMDVYGLHFADPDTGLIVTTNNGFYMTHDGGKTFQTNTGRAGAFVGHLSATDYLLLSSKVIFTTGSSVNGSARLAKSTDGGRTWSYYGPGFQNRLASLAFPTRQVGYACGAVGKVVRTTDGGNSWEQIDAPVNNDLLKIQFRTPTFGLAVGTYGGIVRTTDGGTTWTSVVSGLSFPLIAIHYASDSVAYVGSTQGELALTENGGRTWKVITTPQERINGVREYYFRDNNTVLAMSEYSVYRRDLPGQTTLSALPGASPSRAALHVYPNPAAETLTVQYPASFVPQRLRVYDRQGRLVQEQTQAGHLHAVSVASLPAGIYLLRAESSQNTILNQRFSKL